LKDKIKKEMAIARQEADKKARADYDNRREKAKEEIAELVKRITPEAVAILEKYGMDSDIATEFASGKNYNQVIRYEKYYIENKDEAKALREAEYARSQKEDELIEEFFLECELGVEKANFLDELKKLCSKMAE
jgi:polynucleotide 5'-kinase involved in rRNA processing